jgi:hypothetical protein
MCRDVASLAKLRRPASSPKGYFPCARRQDFVVAELKLPDNGVKSSAAAVFIT